MDDDRSMVVLGAVVGAALGSVAGYLFLTERGRRLRQDLVPQVEAFVHDLRRLQVALAHARAVVSQGLRSDAGPAGERQWNDRDQPAPF
jgi:gas vesicle protein